MRHHFLSAFLCSFSAAGLLILKKAECRRILPAKKHSHGYPQIDTHNCIPSSFIPLIERWIESGYDKEISEFSEIVSDIVSGFIGAVLNTRCCPPVLLPLFGMKELSLSRKKRTPRAGEFFLFFTSQSFSVDCIDDPVRLFPNIGI